jgi:hypothetical protein
MSYLFGISSWYPICGGCGESSQFTVWSDLAGCCTNVDPEHKSPMQAPELGGIASFSGPITTHITCFIGY